MWCGHRPAMMTGGAGGLTCSTIPLMNTIVAIGAHIGDAELMAGPLLSEAAQQGHRVHLVALTAGERGHRTKSPDVYLPQKVAEGKDFAASIGADFTVFDQADASLANSPEVVSQLRDLLLEFHANTVISHWKGSWHPDHVAAHEVTEAACFQASISGPDKPSWIRQVLYAENWEDMEGFAPTVSHPISDAAFQTWLSAIQRHEFARGEASGFRYIDYYTALMTLRGCLADSPRAVALMPKASGPTDLFL